MTRRNRTRTPQVSSESETESQTQPPVEPTHVASLSRPAAQATIKPKDFGAAEHVFTTHAATVPGNITEAELLSPHFWTLVAFKLSAGHEIRVLADDCAFRASLLVTYAYGTEVRVVLLDWVDVEDIDYDALSANIGGYEIKLLGTRKWCIRKVETGELIRENMATQAEAAKELESYQKAMRA